MQKIPVHEQNMLDYKNAECANKVLWNQSIRIRFCDELMSESSEWVVNIIRTSEWDLVMSRWVNVRAEEWILFYKLQFGWDPQI